MTARLFGPLNSGVAVGGDGVATANTSSTHRVRGEVMGLYILYNDSPPAGTTDVTVRTKGTSPAAPTYNFIKVSNAATDGWFYPRVQVCDTVGSAIAGEYTPLVIDDLVNILIEGANAADNVDVWLMLRED